ncbi:hypothetical protein CLU79DRAFT_570714 [Phycomyces nitens]|nr:hypothetical protein CLU79DRAFT_570714 [Phycomyces nitens]
MTLASSSNPNQLVSYQDQFLEILRNISGLQWVRESLSTHSHHYQALEQRHKKETQQRNRLQKQLERQDKEKLSPNQETLDDLDQVLAGLQDQLNSANSVITDLNIEKQKLDRFCNRLHQLYQQVGSLEGLFNCL